MRLPVRVVVLVVVVPVRMLWELLAPLRPVVGRVLVFIGKLIFVWPWVGLWRYVLVPVWRYGIEWPVVRLHRYVLRYVVVVPLVWLGKKVLLPVARGVAWVFVRLVWRPLCWVVVRVVAPPLRLLWRYVLAPVGREILAALAVAGRIGVRLARVVGAALVWCFGPVWRSAVRTARETVEQIRGVLGAGSGR
ncbi:hypothetical protein GCM10010387_20900 [Streptomyces inusitatus]|uniref:Uncharacterized protein n=1 Tax=Streptomyces inusitatus TaxID=68221 RepID=A0A918Q1D0_9ACTN|nr:hypothetical protein [Streptomyces inusitatus]GGZ27322.1 hypothetical protein GCM10010387_20900 [Streptomyces inusitatus]